MFIIVYSTVPLPLEALEQCPSRRVARLVSLSFTSVLRKEGNRGSAQEDAPPSPSPRTRFGRFPGSSLSFPGEVIGGRHEWTRMHLLKSGDGRFCGETSCVCVCLICVCDICVYVCCCLLQVYVVKSIHVEVSARSCLVARGDFFHGTVGCFRQVLC